MKFSEFESKTLFSLVCFIFAVYLINSSNAFAANWELSPRLNLSETYTDNVRFGGGGSDFITQINPGLSLAGTGRRLNVDASYTMNNLIYARNSNLTRMRHLLNASATTELLEDLFFVDGSARIFQQNTNLFGPQTANNVFVTGNRTNVMAYNISPYLRHRFKNFASAELRYAHGIVESSANGLRDSQRESYQANLTSGDAFRILNWGLSYSHQSIHFDRSGFRPSRTVELERSIASLRYNITPRFGLTATGGYERNSFISIRGDPSSPTWTVGFIWIPSERTEISARAGQRFFGDTYGAELRHRTRLTTWQASYDEDITTFNQQALMGTTFFDTGAFVVEPGSDSLGNFLSANNFLTNRLFLQRRAQAMVTINGAKNTLSFRVFDWSRKAFSPEEEDIDLAGIDNLSLLNNTRQTGGNVSWSYRFSPRTTANINASFVRLDFRTVDRIDYSSIYTAGLTRRFQPNLTGNMIFRHIERNSKQVNDFIANSITASVTMNF